MTALRYPAAVWKPLGPQTEPAMTGHDIVCLHTMVGYLISTDRYFRDQGYGGTESHYGIGGKWGPDAAAGLDGVVWQWQDRGYTADANLDGNPRVISVETADNAPARAEDIESWTPAQVSAIAKLLAWECSPAAHAGCPSTWQCHTVGIPLQLIPDTRPTRRGIGYHRQGIDPWRVDGGVRWSSSTGKACPTDRRIKQIPGIITLARSTATPAPQPTGDDVTEAQAAQIIDLLEKIQTDVYLLQVRAGSVTNQQMPDLRAVLRVLVEQTGGDADQIRAKLDEIAADTDRTADQVAGADA